MDAKFNYVLRLADTCLIHSQRLSEWAGHAPVLEEDLATYQPREYPRRGNREEAEGD